MASMLNKILKEDVTTFQSKAVCVEYTATLKLGFGAEQLQPLPEFKAALDKLPAAYTSCYLPTAIGGACPQRQTAGFGDLPSVKTGSRRLQATLANTTVNDCACDASVAKYFRFIQLFGTHYTTRVEMGGKIVHRLEIKNSDIETLKTKNVDVAYGASIKASYDAVVGSVSASVEGKSATSSGRKSFNSVMEVAQKEININVGGSPSENWREWAKSMTNTPMPIRYRLSSLIDLIHNVDATKVAPFQAAVKDYIAAYGKTLSSTTAPNTKVKSVKIKYTAAASFMGWIQFRVMIGTTGSMNPVDLTLYDTSGTFTVDVPPKYQFGFGAFDNKVPVTIQYIGGRFYPPGTSANMEAKKAQHHAHAKATEHWINMEAKHAMAGQGSWKANTVFGVTQPGAVTLLSVQAFAMMSDGAELSLGDAYAGAQLALNREWPVNPMP